MIRHRGQYPRLRRPPPLRGLRRDGTVRTVPNSGHNQPQHLRQHQYQSPAPAPARAHQEGALATKRRREKQKKNVITDGCRKGRSVISTTVPFITVCAETGLTGDTATAKKGCLTQVRLIRSTLTGPSTRTTVAPQKRACAAHFHTNQNRLV